MWQTELWNFHSAENLLSFWEQQICWLISNFLTPLNFTSRETWKQWRKQAVFASTQKVLQC